MIKFPGTVPGRNWPEATAHRARRPAMRGRLKSRLGHGLAAQPIGATGLHSLLQRARRRGHHAHTARGTARWRARWRQSVARDLEGVTGKVPGKDERAGAHRNGGSTTRREESSETAAFAGGEGAPMGGDGGCGVLQHRCERGKLGLAPIWEWCGSEGAHRRGGRRRWRSVKSDAKERPPVAGGSGLGAGAMWRGVALERGTREEWVTGARMSGGSAVLWS
jgi:hypothetical protein